METRDLGASGLRTSRLGFGMWPIGGTKELNDYGSVDDQQALGAIRRALDLGVTLFDTAPAYGDGRAEGLLREGLGTRTHEAVIVTKCAVHWDRGTEAWVTDSSRDAIVRSAEISLERLGRDVIDVLLIHVPDPVVAPDEPMRAFEDLKTAGKIRASGVSNFSLPQLEAYRAIGSLDVIQVGYHLFDRRMEREMLAYAQAHGLGVMTYGSLAHGLLTGAWTADQTFTKNDWRAAGDSFGLPLFTETNLPLNVAVVDRLKEVAARSGHSVAQLAIAWVLLNDTVSVALTGARQPSEIEDNAAGVAWSLPPDVVEEIGTIMEAAAGRSVEGEYIVNQRPTDSQ